MNLKKYFEAYLNDARITGSPLACYAVGHCLELGLGTPMDAEAAESWYQSAFSNRGLAVITEKANSLWGPDGLEDAEAEFLLGRIYEKGQAGLSVNYAEALKWYRKSAVQYNVMAQCNLGLMYARGRGVAKDEVEAFLLYRRAAEKGYAKGQFYLGLMYANGQGIAKNKSEAIKLYHAAALQEFVDAQYHLGFIYANGLGVVKNKAKAVYWYRKALSNGSEDVRACLEKIKITPALEQKIKAVAAANVPAPLSDYALTLEDRDEKPIEHAPTAPSPITSIPTPVIPASLSIEPSLTSPGQLQSQLGILHCEVTRGQVIGQGGFGTVYKATWHRTPVALKELDIRGQLDTTLLKDFRQEADIMTHLRHPRIVALLGATFTPPYWLVLELLSKGALSSLLHSSTDISWPQRLQWAQQIAEGLVYLHSKGIIHQDLKSMNILLNESNQAKIADFGLAKLKLTSQTSSLHSNPTGTLAWIAPEILTQEKGASSQTDMFSYGMILWELAARKAPYENAGNAALIIAWAIQGKFPAIPEETPPAFRQLIEGCRSGQDTRPTAYAVLTQLTMWTSPAPQHALPSWQDEEVKNEIAVPDKYQGGLASGNFIVDNTKPQNSQPASPARGALQNYRGALFSNRGTASQASGQGQMPISRGRSASGQAPLQHGAKPFTQGSCRNQ